MDKVEKVGGCWMWRGAIYRNGYGVFTVKSDKGWTNTLAHRWAYSHLVGPIPDGMDLDHTCHNSDPSCPNGYECLHRRCVNPAHLEPVTHRVNMLRGNTVASQHAAKTHCVNGHPLTGENLRVRRGVRECIECSRAQARVASRKYNAKRKAAMYLESTVQPVDTP